MRLATTLILLLAVSACAKTERFSCDQGDQCVDYLFNLTEQEAADSCSGDVREGNVCEEADVGSCEAVGDDGAILLNHYYGPDWDAVSAEADCVDVDGFWTPPA